jgi:serine/threonine-protein kinase
VPRPRATSCTIPLDASNTRQPRTRVVGDYIIVAPIARGGTSGVYLAEHVETKQRVALKVLDPFYAARPEVVDRMMFEYTVARMVRHPGLLEVHHAERGADGVTYLVMEYLDGENLGALADREYVQLDAILALGAQIATAIAALHNEGAIHCDLKPNNIILLFPDVGTGPGGWPRTKVIDYGVARLADAVTQQDSTIAGTPAYMAPEQWRGAPSLKSDVYALGCLLYELVVGEPPFRGPLPQLMMLHAQQLAVRPSVTRTDVHPELERWIMRALAKDEAMRPHMADLAYGLLRCLGDVAPARHRDTLDLLCISS